MHRKDEKRGVVMVELKAQDGRRKKKKKKKRMTDNNPRLPMRFLSFCNLTCPFTHWLPAAHLVHVPFLLDRVCLQKKSQSHGEAQARRGVALSQSLADGEGNNKNQLAAVCSVTERSYFEVYKYTTASPTSPAQLLHQLGFILIGNCASLRVAFHSNSSSRSQRGGTCR